jgi:CheY-like chemotaxis protein
VLQEQATDLVALSQAFPQARLRIAPTREVPPVEGDEAQLAQVLRAIVQNGLEALEGPGEVTVYLSTVLLGASDLDTPTWVERPEPGLQLCVEVRDSGAGMSPETLARVGDPFFSTKAAGRGMGIPAARGILRGHGGGLWFASEPGAGTTVRAYFPAAEGTPSRELPPQVVQAASAPRGRLILLVDDEADLREAMAEVLTEVLGFEVIQAADGVEGLEAFRARADEIALVLMDAKMPRMGGTDAFQAMKQLRPGARALLCSGYGEEFGLATAQTYGFLGFLKKPFGIPALKEAIEQALSG